MMSTYQLYEINMNENNGIDNEIHRLEMLRALKILDTPPEERFDRLTRLAAKLFQVPMSSLSLIDADRQWRKSRYGIEDIEMPRELSFCSETINEDDIIDFFRNLLFCVTLNNFKFKEVIDEMGTYKRITTGSLSTTNG
ncbi:MAG: diguanylate cyclase with sensor, partial [Francisellaceae bacterium]|nr:diguanylate cyclase with sensor [Francisellaceae bacterium]